MKHYYMILVLALLLVPMAMADSTNKTIYYKIYPNQTMELYDKGNFTVRLNASNDAVERAFTLLIDYNTTIKANTTTGDLTIYCGDTTTSFTCPAITLPTDPACPAFPTIPACPAAPACPSPSDEVGKQCISSFAEATTKKDYSTYIITAIVAAALLGAMFVLGKKGTDGSRPIIVQKGNQPAAAAVETPKPQPPMRRQAPQRRQEDGVYYGEYDDKPASHQPDFDYEPPRQTQRAPVQREPIPNPDIEELRQQSGPRKRKSLEEREQEMEKMFGGQNGRR